MSRLSDACLVAAAGLFFVHAWLLRQFIVDDAFITFRFARNIARGLGPIYNPGERVEGFSNPLYTYVLSGLHRLVPHEDVFPTAARLLGVLATLGSLAVLARLPGLERGAALGLALILTALSTSLALWSIGGLETSLYGFVLLVAFALTLARPATARGQVSLGLALAAVALSRPEGVLPAGVLFASRFFDSRSRRDFRGHAVIALAAILPVAAYLGFRRAYYGQWVPNTYFAKRLPMGEALPKGRYYLTGFIRQNGGFLLYVPALAALFDRRHRRIAWLAAAVAAACLGFALRAGGDWMQNHRFVAPVVPFLSLLVALGWMRLFGLAAARWSVAARPLRVLAFVLPLALLAGSTSRLIAEQRSKPYVAVSPYFDTVGRMLGVAAPPEWTLALHDIGAIGWYGRMRVLDLLGLVEPDIAHRRLTLDEIVERRRPELILLHYDNRTPPRTRWQPIAMPGFDSLYVAPKAPFPVPGSLRVRVDVAPRFEAGLRRMPPGLIRDLEKLDSYLASHEPDGFQILPRQPL